MKLEEIHYEEVFDSLPEEKQSELIGRNDGDSTVIDIVEILYN